MTQPKYVAVMGYHGHDITIIIIVLHNSLLVGYRSAAPGRLYLATVVNWISEGLVKLFCSIIGCVKRTQKMYRMLFEILH